MDASGILNLQLSMSIDGLLVHEHHLPIDGRVTIGRELRGNLITWHKLPPSLTLLESRAGNTLLNLHPALVIRLHREGEIQPQRLGNIGQIVLRRDDVVEIDLQGASLTLEFFDPSTMPAVFVPRAERTVNLANQGRVLKSVVGLSFAAQLAFMLAPGLPRVDFSPEPTQSPSVAEVSADAETEASPDDIADDRFDQWVAEHTLEGDTRDGVTEQETAARVNLPEPVRREQPHLEQELERLLDEPTSDKFASAAMAATQRGVIDHGGLSSAGRSDDGANGVRVTTQPGALSERASRGIAIDIQDVARHRPSRDKKVRYPATNDTKVFHDAILRRRSSFQRCYENQLKSNSELAGRITLHFRVQPAGSHSRIVAITAEKDEVGGGVAECMTRVMSRMKLPLPAENTEGLETGMSFVFAVGD